MVPLFYDAETFLRKRNGIAEVLQANFLLDVIVVFGRKGGDEILYGNAGIGSSLTFQFFQFLVRRTDIESVDVENPASIAVLARYCNVPVSSLFSNAPAK